MPNLSNYYTDMETRTVKKDWYPRGKYSYALIFAVLQSYEYVKRQIQYMNGFMHKYPEWEVIIIDDGSEPSIISQVDLSLAKFRLRVVQSFDTRNWSQPCARNLGAKLSGAGMLLFTDIDHAICEQAVIDTMLYKGHKLHYQRVRGVLLEDGNVERSPEILLEHHCPADRINQRDQHYNTFAVRHWIFDLMGGYDPRFCGAYGGDDTDFSNRYSYLCRTLKRVDTSDNSEAELIVYPDAKSDTQHLFHDIRHKIVAERRRVAEEKKKKNEKK